MKPKAVEEEVSQKTMSVKSGKGFLRRQRNMFLRNLQVFFLEKKVEKIHKKVTKDSYSTG